MPRSSHPRKKTSLTSLDSTSPSSSRLLPPLLYTYKLPKEIVYTRQATHLLLCLSPLVPLLSGFGLYLHPASCLPRSPVTSEDHVQGLQSLTSTSQRACLFPGVRGAARSWICCHPRAGISIAPSLLLLSQRLTLHPALLHHCSALASLSAGPPQTRASQP